MESAQSENERLDRAEVLRNVQREYARLQARLRAGEPEERFIYDRTRARLCISNFLITINSNENPAAGSTAFQAISNWLLDTANDLFGDLNNIRTHVLKHPRTTNENPMLVDASRLMRIRSRIALEQNRRAQQGKVHIHVLLEVNHIIFVDERGLKGVQVNVRRIREFLGERLEELAIQLGRNPKKPYVNVRLLTTSTDPNQDKWLTLQYITKQVIPAGATAKDRYVARSMQNADRSFTINGGDPEVINDVIQYEGGMDFDDGPLDISGDIIATPEQSRRGTRLRRPFLTPETLRKGMESGGEESSGYQAQSSTAAGSSEQWGLSSEEDSKGKGEADEDSREKGGRFVRAEDPNDVSGERESTDEDLGVPSTESSWVPPNWRQRRRGKSKY
jgi:hypothetical protein